jgi:hypothetical protein
VKILIDEITFLASNSGNTPANFDESLIAALRTDSTGDRRREGRDKDPEKKTGQEDTPHGKGKPGAGPGSYSRSQQNDDNPDYQHF